MLSFVRTDRLAMTDRRRTPITAHHTPLTREQIEDLLRMLADAFKAEDEDAERNAATADGMADGMTDGTQDDAVQGRTD